MPLPKLNDQDTQDIPYISDHESKQSQTKVIPEVIPTHQAFAAVVDDQVDIRPRFFDKESKQYVLLDTGAQCSCAPPTPGASPDPSLAVEAVDGSLMTCYGRKQQTFHTNRKKYHQQMVITDTTETILGMDFIKNYKIDFRWGELGDYYMYDTIAKISTPLEFVKFPKGSLPAISRVAAVKSVQGRVHDSTVTDPDLLWQHYQVAAVASLGPEVSGQAIPVKYQKLIDKYPSLKKPDFQNIKHNVEHAIDTGNAPPVRCKARPLLPGSPKAIAGHKAWKEMEDLGIIERVDPNEAHYYSSPLHLQDKPDGSQRPCGDYRALNEQTLQDAYNLPNINHFHTLLQSI